MQTKREREARPSAVSTSSSFERIIESYLREDFASVERLSGQYLSSPRPRRAEEVAQMRSVALIKLGRSTVPRPEASNRDTLENGSAPSNVSLLRSKPTFGTGYGSAQAAQPLRQLGVEESGLYTVQVGSFSRQANAERLLDRLLRNRYDAYLNKEVARLVRVRVGHLATREEALGLERRLKKDGYPTKIFP